VLAPVCANLPVAWAGGPWEQLEGQQGTSRVPSGTSGVALGRATQVVGQSWELGRSAECFGQFQLYIVDVILCGQGKYCLQHNLILIDYQGWKL